MKFKEHRLGDLIESISVTHKFPKNEIIFLNTSDILEGSVLTDEYKDVVGLPGQAKKSIKKGDILYSEIRPKNKRYAFIDFDSENYVVSTKLMVLRVKDYKLLNNKYLYYYLTCNNIVNHLQNLAESRSGTFPQITFTEVASLEIALPTLQTQKSVVDFMDDLNDKLNVNNAIISNLEELAQTLFKRWFVDFEFPNEEGNPYKSSGGKMVESELGMIPEGWNLNKLNEISKLIMGLSPKSSTYNEEGEGLPLLNGAADFNGSSLAPKRYTSDPKRISIKSDLVLCIRATIGNLTYSDSEYALGRGVAAIRPYKIKYSELLYHFVLRSINRLKAQATGSVISGLSKPDLENIIILVPDDKKLNKFHNVFSSIQLKQQQLSEENIRLVNIRDTLLPKLLSGEVELPDDMEVTDDVPIS